MFLLSNSIKHTSNLMLQKLRVLQIRGVKGESPCSHVIKKSLLYPKKLPGNNRLKYNKHCEELWQYRCIFFGEMLRSEQPRF
jgi:hypothetical protein